MPRLIGRLNAALDKAVNSETARASFARIGFDPGGGSPEAFGTLVHAEIMRWGKVIKDAGVKMNP